MTRLLTRLYDEHLQRAGLTSTQFALLMTLRQGRNSSTELMRLHGFDKSTLSRNLRVLTRNGWIATSPGRDRRVRRPHLTPAGRRRVTEAASHWNAAQSTLRSLMTAAEWQALLTTFRAISSAIDTSTAGAPPVSADPSS